MFASWYGWAMLAAESQEVITLRLLKIAAGGAKGRKEAERMVWEKLEAANHAATRLLLGQSPDNIVDGYRKVVRANARRLSK